LSLAARIRDELEELDQVVRRVAEGWERALGAELLAFAEFLEQQGA